MIKLYTTGCPQCKILEGKMKAKGIEPDEIISDMDTLINMGLISVPVLEIDGETHTFAAAVKWVNEQEVKS